MGAEDKAKNFVDDTAGKIKEGWGKLTDDERLEAEGKAQQAAADIKKAGENVKDAFKD